MYNLTWELKIMNQEEKRLKNNDNQLQIFNKNLNISNIDVQLKTAKIIMILGIVGQLLCFTIIGAIITVVLDIISSSKILSTKWEVEQVQNQIKFWAGASIIFPFFPIVFGVKVRKHLIKRKLFLIQEN